MNLLRRLIFKAMNNSEFMRRVATRLLSTHTIFGDESRFSMAKTAVINNALINVSSGSVTIADHVFLGHNVCLLTGTHDYLQSGDERQRAIPETGRDIVIEEGAWIASNVTVLGPVRIGAHSVVAAGAVLTRDVPPDTLFAGVPAVKIRDIKSDG